MYSFRLSLAQSWKKTRMLLLAIGIAALAPLSHAGTITGTVTGPDGEPFRGAFIAAQNLKTKITVMVLSQKDGHYRVENLPAGTYDVQAKAVGYRSEPHTGLSLTAQQDGTAQLILQKAAVLWSDLSIYQGEVLLPNLPGKRLLLTDGTRPIRDSPCQICHSFQNKMAPWVRNDEGWRTRVEYMRNVMNCCNSPDTGVNDKDADLIVSYLTSLFGPNSVLPASPTDDPKYKSTVHTFSDDALNIVYVEYELPGPNRMPWSATPDGHGSEWMPYKSDVSKIGRLNEETGEVTEYRVPNPGATQIHRVYPGPGWQRVAGRKQWSEETGTMGSRRPRRSPNTRTRPASTPCASVQRVSFAPQGRFRCSIPRPKSIRTSTRRLSLTETCSTRKGIAGSPNSTRRMGKSAESTPTHIS